MMAMDLTGSTESWLRYDVDDCEKRIRELEARVDDLTRHMTTLADTVTMCLEYLKRIEDIDRDAMRMLSMYVGYSDGEQ